MRNTRRSWIGCLGVLLLLVWASPVTAVEVVTGSYTGNDTDDRDITISPACQPIAVFVKRRTTSAVHMVSRFSVMGTDVSKQVTGTTAQVTTAIKALNSDGFRVGTISAVNLGSNTYDFLAICDNGANDVAVTSWSGNNGDNRDVTISPAFSPEIVIVLQSSTGAQSWRGTVHDDVGDSASRLMGAQGNQSNDIQAFAADGFQVGTNLNASGITYYALALKGSSGVATGKFTGNTSDNREIATIANPDFVMVKGHSASNLPAFRFSSQTGDAAYCGNAVAAVNIIQEFSATGFQVGTSACANENTVTMYWFAITDFSLPTTAPRRRAF